MGKVRCPDCGYKERVPEDWERSTIRCTECGFKIPLDEDEQDEPERVVKPKKKSKPLHKNKFVKSVVGFFVRLDLTLKIIGGIALLAVLLGCIHPLFPIVAGCLLMIGGSLLFIVIVFNDSPFEAMLCWIVPFYSLYYLVTHFDDCKQALFLQLFGMLVCFSFVCGLPVHIGVSAMLGKFQRGPEVGPDNNPPMANNDMAPRRDRDGMPGRDGPPADGNRDRNPPKDIVGKDKKGPPPVEQPQVVTGDKELDEALFDLAGNDGKKHKAAVLHLMATQPNQHQPAVARKLADLVQVNEEWRHEPILNVMKTWATKEEVPVLIKLLDNNSINTRNRTLAVLGVLKDERSVAPVVRAFTVFQTRYHGGEALKAMGPIAEKEVLGLLNQPNKDMWVPAIQLLEHVGTQQSIPTLQRAAGDFSLKGVSEGAIASINKRTKK